MSTSCQHFKPRMKCALLSVRPTARQHGRRSAYRFFSLLLSLLKRDKQKSVGRVSGVRSERITGIKILGKPGAEYIRFQAPMLVLIASVGLLRMGLSLIGIADPVVRWLSLTALLLIGMVYAAVRVQTTSFGNYRHLCRWCSFRY